MTPSREKAARLEFLEERNRRLKNCKSARLARTASKMRQKTLTTGTKAQVAQRLRRAAEREHQMTVEALVRFEANPRYSPRAETREYGGQIPPNTEPKDL